MPVREERIRPTWEQREKLPKLQLFKMLEATNPNREFWNDTQMSWQTYQNRAERTATIDYGCDFDSRGICKSRRQSTKSTDEHTQMACCSGCAIAVGYLGCIPKGKAWFFAKLWSKATGFWRKGIGCTLPRKYRSKVCLGFQCYDMSPNQMNVHRFMTTGKLVQIKPLPEVA